MTTINQHRRQQIRQLQKPIALMLGIWVLFLVSFAIAWFRVSNREAFPGTPFHRFELKEPTHKQPNGT